MKVRNLAVSFRGASRDDRIVDGLDLDVPGGRVVSLFGPNGCGKSSTLRALLQAPRLGLATSADVWEVPRRTRIGYVPQDAASAVMPHMSAAMNAALPLVLSGESWPAALRWVLTVAATVIEGLPLQREAQFLSGGERQLLVLLRELSRRPEPEVLLIDEGFVSMDYIRRFSVMASLRRWVATTGASILAVGHDAEELALFSDVVVVTSAAPMRAVASLEISGPEPRDVRCLGAPWLLDATGRIQRTLVGAVGGAP